MMGGMMQGMMGQGMGMGAGHGMGPMMQIGVFQPEHLLARKDVLALSVEQVKRLSELQAAATKAHDEAHAAAEAHHEPLVQMITGPRPDAQEIRKHFEAAHAAMGRAHWVRIDAAIQAKGVLTDVQRARVQGWADAAGAGARHGMHGGAMGPGAGPMDPGAMIQPGMGGGMMYRGEAGCPQRP
jgi:hypothetical protein